MLWAESSKLWTYHFVVDHGFIYQVYDTTNTQHITDGHVVEKNFGLPGTPQHKAGPKNAYVWGEDKALYAASHRTGKLHHSSFLGGDAVRCAGMIGVKNGKVTWIDNDSGHYRPGTHHLHNLVSYLNKYQVFAPKAIVNDMAENKSASVREFLSRSIDGSTWPRPASRPVPGLTSSEVDTASCQRRSRSWQVPPKHFWQRLFARIIVIKLFR